MKKYKKQTIAYMNSYLLLFGIIALLLFIYIISPSFIDHIVKIIVDFIGIKIIKTFPLDNQVGVNLQTDLNVIFNVPISNLYITIDSAIINKKNSSENLINNIKVEKNKVQFNLTKDLDSFSNYKLILNYTAKDSFNRYNTKTEEWSFTTNSGLTPPLERPCTNIYSPKDVKIEYQEKHCKKENQNIIPYDVALNIINGSKDADKIYGKKNNDTIYGNEGNDTIYGGDGNDVITGGLGSDYLSGRNGNDYIYTGIKEDIQLTNIVTIDEVLAGDGNDEVVSDGYDLIDCGSGVDSVNYMNTSKYINCEELKRR